MSGTADRHRCLELANQISLQFGLLVGMDAERAVATVVEIAGRLADFVEGKKPVPVLLERLMQEH
jgi:hypothetical protein